MIEAEAARISEIRRSSLAVGQADYLAKTNAATELLDTIAAVLAGRDTSA